MEPINLDDFRRFQQQSTPEESLLKIGVQSGFDPEEERGVVGFSVDGEQYLLPPLLATQIGKALLERSIRARLVEDVFAHLKREQGSAVALATVEALLKE